MAKATVIIEDQVGKENLHISIDFEPDLEMADKMTPAQAAGLSFIDWLTAVKKEEKT